MRHCVVLLGVVGLLACSPTLTPTVDAGAPAESGLSTDAGEALDAGALTDAGTLTDAGMVTDAGWTPLWNGVDFQGWVKWLGNAIPGQPVMGLDSDPRGVFSIVQLDGEPAIHVTGEVWGALITNAEYGNFELEAEYRWGVLVWPPLNLHDSGLMYLSTGDYGAVNAGGDALSSPVGSGSFMVSMEYQLVPGDIGGLYRLGPISHVEGPRAAGIEDPGWNRVRIVVRSDASEHYLNDLLVRSTTGFTLRLPGQAPTPLTRGRIQLQSEGGELYFRRLRTRPLP